MNKKVIPLILILIGTALLYTAVRFTIFEPNAFRGYGDFLNALIKTAQGIVGLIADISGVIFLFKKDLFHFMAIIIVYYGSTCNF